MRSNSVSKYITPEILVMISLLLLMLSSLILLFSTNELKIWTTSRTYIIEWDKVLHISGVGNYTFYEKIYGLGPRFTIRGTLSKVNETHYLIHGNMRAMLNSIEGRTTSKFMIIGKVSYTIRSVMGYAATFNILGLILGFFGLAFSFILKPRYMELTMSVILAIISIIANIAIVLYLTKIS